MKRSKPNLTESDLSRALIKYFKDNNIVVYGEVACGLGFVDHVVKNKNCYTGIELKLGFNLKVLLQAIRLLSSFNRVYIVVIEPSHEAREICEHLGIGLIGCRYYAPIKTFSFYIYNEAKLNKNPLYLKHSISSLTDYNIDVVAGKKRVNKKITQFNLIMWDFYNYLKSSNSASPEELFKFISTKYSYFRDIKQLKNYFYNYYSHFAFYDRKRKVYRFLNKRLAVIQNPLLYEEYFDCDKVDFEVDQRNLKPFVFFENSKEFTC